MNSIFKRSLLAVGVALAVAAPATAQNTQFTMTNDFSNDGVVSITDNGGSSYESVYAGRYTADIAGATDNIFCVDPAHEIWGGTTYNADVTENITSAAGSLQSSGPDKGYYNGGLSSAMTSTDLDPQNLNVVSGTVRSDEVAFLADDYLNATTFTGALSGTTNLYQNETAVQLAIWDIITDGGYQNGTDLTGDFGIAGNTSSTYVTAMDYYLEEAAADYSSGASSDAEWVQAPVTVESCGTDDHYQDFVALPGQTPPDGTPVVPEPGIGAFLFSLAIAGGIMILLKRRAVKVS